MDNPRFISNRFKLLKGAVVTISSVFFVTVPVILFQGGHKPGKPGILRDFSEHRKLREFSGSAVQPQGKIVTNKVFLVRHSNVCVKQLLTG